MNLDIVCQQGSERHSKDWRRLIPLNKVFEMFLDQHAEFVLDFGNVLYICWAPVGDLVILEALVALVVARCTVALRRRTAGSASQRRTRRVAAPLSWGS